MNKKILNFLFNRCQRENARAHDVYMNTYYTNRKKNAYSWEFHDRKIYDFIFQKLSQEKVSSAEFIGIIATDFFNKGSVSLCNTEKLGEILFQLENVNLVNISEKSLLEISAFFESKKISQENITLICDDITGGISASLFDFFFENIIRQDSVFSVIESLEEYFFEIVQSIDFIYEKRYPLSDVSFSIMTHTATLVPLQELMFSFMRSKNYSDEEVDKIEKRLFSFLRKYNAWLLKFSIEQWFERNKEGKFYVVTDIGKLFYKDEVEKTVDENRRYENIDFSLLKEMEKEFLISIEDTWNWEDEDDHFHPIAAISVQKKV